MRHSFITLLVLLTVTFVPTADAARDQSPVSPVHHGLRLIVITAPGCIYCRHFRQNIGPTYQESHHGSEIPLVYIDVNDQAADDLLLSRPVRVVPTIVLVAGQREVNRIDGYLGPANFFKAFRSMLTNR